MHYLCFQSITKPPILQTKKIHHLHFVNKSAILTPEVIKIDYQRELGITLKQLRKERGLTTRELAEMLSISASYLSQIETAKRNASIELLGKIAEAVEVSYFDLLKIAGHNDLINLYYAKQLNSKRQSTDEFIHIAADMKVLLEQENLTLKAKNIKPKFNGHELTADEATRALAMLYILFPHYIEPKK